MYYYFNRKYYKLFLLHLYKIGGGFINQKLIAVILVVIAVVGGALIYAFGIGGSASNSNGTVTITDVAGRTVNVPAQVNKVVGTGCSAREIVYLNASDKIVGIEQTETNSTGGWGNQLPYMIAHPELMSLPIVGDARKTVINYEAIANLKPDVVFAADATQAADIESKTGIPTVVVYTMGVGTTEQMAKYKDSLKIMGKVLGKTERADELVSYINSCEEDLNKRTKDDAASKNTTAYVGGHAYRGSHGITSTNAFYPPFRMVNAKNVASSVSTNDTSIAVQIDKEQLINWNPDVIFIEESSLASVVNDTTKYPEYKDLKAVKNDQVYGLMSYCLYSYNKDILLADAYYVGKVLYPEQFSDVDPEKKADEIFVKFVGKPVYNQMKAVQGGFKKIEI